MTEEHSLLTGSMLKKLAVFAFKISLKVRQGNISIFAVLPEMQAGNFSECQKIKTICYSYE